MANPNVPQGTLNRLATSLVINNFPELNVIPSFLGKEMITLGFSGDITTMIQTTTGTVTSPEPYQMVVITVHLLKTQALAPAYKAQLELNSLLGDITAWPDVQPGVALPPYQCSNCAITEVRELAFNGVDAGWAVVIKGTYIVNSALFNG